MREDIRRPCLRMTTLPSHVGSSGKAKLKGDRSSGGPLYASNRNSLRAISDSTPAGAHFAGGEAVAPRSRPLRDGPRGGRQLDERPRSRRCPVEVVEAPSLLRATTNLIKLDVEGYEFEILDSMFPLILERQPTIFVEVRDYLLLRELIGQLATEARYSIYAVG